MKKILTLIMITFLLIALSSPTAFAQENEPPNFVDTLYSRVINQISGFLVTHTAKTKEAIDNKAAAVQNAIQNYNTGFIENIATALAQHRSTIISNKLQALESMMNDYVSTMEEQKPEIINEMKQQLQQQADEDYEKAVNRMLENLK